MARKEINVFGASFLDLLSGALGAVIILYVIVPKLTAEQSDILEQVDQLNEDLTEISTILDEYRQSVPEAMYEELMAQFQAMEDRINDLQQSAAAGTGSDYRIAGNPRGKRTAPGTGAGRTG